MAAWLKPCPFKSRLRGAFDLAQRQVRKHERRRRVGRALRDIVPTAHRFWSRQTRQLRGLTPPTFRKGRERWGTLRSFCSPRKCGPHPKWSEWRRASLRGLNRNSCLGGMAEAMPFSSLVGEGPSTWLRGRSALHERRQKGGPLLFETSSPPMHTIFCNR